MGCYFQPPTEIDLDSVGRRIITSYDATYSQITSRLNPGEELVGLYDRGLFKIAPYLFDEREYQEFEGQYNRGQLLSRILYAVKTESD